MATTAPVSSFITYFFSIIIYQAPVIWAASVVLCFIVFAICVVDRSSEPMLGQTKD
jgi:hypothetical protein